MSLESERGAFVFFSYAHRDKYLRDRLEEHLSNLKYRGLITTWHDQEIQAGEERGRQIDIYLNKAHIILLLISPHFMASEYCYSIEMKRALERHERREVDVIPILLRPVLFTDAPFAKLQMLPTNGKPVRRWRDQDSAFVDIAYGIERVAQSRRARGNLIGPPVYDADGFIRRPPARGRRLPLLPISIGVSVVGLIILGILALSQHPNLITLVITTILYILAIILGLLLLIAVVVAVGKVIGAIRARSEQRRTETAGKRRYYEKAIEAYRSALLSNPIDGNALRGMGNALYALERYDQALDTFTRAIDCDPTPAAYAGLGNVFARLERYSEAVATYEKAIELDPMVTFNNNDFVQSLLALGRKEDVEQARARAQQLGYEDDS